MTIPKITEPSTCCTYSVSNGGAFAATDQIWRRGIKKFAMDIEKFAMES
jgi:hypothetical protein